MIGNKFFEVINRMKSDKQTQANFIMLIVTMCWGSSYLFMKMGLDSFEGFNLIALRFIIAFVLAGAIFYKKLIRINFKTIFYAFILGTLLFLMMAAVTIGLKFTTASNAGFLFSLAIVFVPILLAIFFKKKTEKRVLYGICFTVTGIALLTLNNKLNINIGDYFVILGALFYALQIIVTDKLTKNVDSITLGILQLGFGGAWGLLFSFIFEKPHLPNNTDAWISIMALSILCSAIGFIGQAVAQKHTTPTHTSLIFSLEPVFSALFAFMFIGEILPTRGYIGAILIMIGVLIAQFNIKNPFVGKRFSHIFDGSKI